MRNLHFFSYLVRNGMLSSVTMNDLSSYSNSHNKHLKFVNTISMNDLQTCAESNTTPIRFNKTLMSTPGSVQRRRALGLVNQNSTHINRVSSINDLANLNTKTDETIKKKLYSNQTIDDDLPHKSSKYEDTFDDLIPSNERIERFMINQTNGVNILNCFGGIENTIRCQSPVCNRLNTETLIDMMDLFN